MHPIILPLLSSLLLLILIKFTYTIIWKPFKIQRHLYKQGIRGPGYRPIFGNSAEFKDEFERTYVKPMGDIHHDIVHRANPCYHKWTALYGKTMLFWHGSTPRIALSDPEMMKDVYLNKSGHVVKVPMPPLAEKLFGKGLIDLHGEKWAPHRKVANPAFAVDRVKSWIHEVAVCVQKVVDDWGEDETEVDVSKVFRFISAEIIAKTAFGSNFEEGKHIFESQDQQIAIGMNAFRDVYLPGLRYLPTKDNRKRWKLEKETRSMIRRLIERENKAGGNSKSLLSFLLQSDLPVEEVIDECQTFYLAGKNAVKVFLSWTILLLAMHPEWQSRAREEVLRVFKNGEIPNADTLSDLKIVNSIINEVLRLYPPIPALLKQASKDMKVGNLDVPAGTQFYLPVTAAHHDTEIWGEDAHEFNPERFVEPRKHLASFSPFSLGTRSCIGQKLVTMEGKIVLAVILGQFTFKLSPSYVHAPVTYLALTPQFGVPVIFKKISS